MEWWESDPVIDGVDTMPRPMDDFSSDPVVDPSSLPAVSWEFPKPKTKTFPKPRERTYQEAVAHDLQLTVYDNKKHFPEMGVGGMDYVANRVPFLGSAMSAVSSADAYLSARRLANAKSLYTGYYKDIQTLGDFLSVQQNVAKSEKDKGWGRKVLDTITKIPGFAVEFATTGPVFTVAKRGARKAATAALGQSAKSKAGQLAVRGAGFAAGAAAQTAAMPQRVAEATARDLTNQITIKDGKLDVGEDYAGAAYRGVGDAYIETASERLGGLLGKVPGVKKAGQAIGGAIGRAFGARSAIPALTRSARRAGIHSAPGEMFEEAIGDVARGATGVRPDYGTVGKVLSGDPKGIEDLSIQAAAFSAFPAGKFAAERLSALADTKWGRKEFAEATGLPVDQTPSRATMKAAVESASQQSQSQPAPVDTSSTGQLPPQAEPVSQEPSEQPWIEPAPAVEPQSRKRPDPIDRAAEKVASLNDRVNSLPDGPEKDAAIKLRNRLAGQYEPKEFKSRLQVFYDQRKRRAADLKWQARQQTKSPEHKATIARGRIRKQVQSLQRKGVESAKPKEGLRDIGPAIWNADGTDIPVTIKHVSGVKDGDVYVAVEGSNAAVNLKDIRFEGDPKPQPPPPPEMPEATPGDSGLTLVGMGSAISDNYYKGIERSIRDTGQVPSAEANSLVGQLWSKLDGKVSPTEFVAGLREGAADSAENAAAFANAHQSTERKSMGAAASYPGNREITSKDVAAQLADIDEAARLTKPKFEAWVKEKFGFQPSGTKAQMRKQAADFVKRLAVSDTQVREANTPEQNRAMDERKSVGASGAPQPAVNPAGAAAVQTEAWGMGRPELANPGETESQRDRVDDLDELRKLKGKPATKSDTVTNAEADAITDEQARTALAEKLMLTDAETVAARRALRNQLDKSLKGEEFAETARMFDQWRNSGTEQARAFRQRIDTKETPAERSFRILGEAIFTRQKTPKSEGGPAPPTDWQKDMEALRDKLRRQGIELDQLKDIAKDPVAAAQALTQISAAKADAWDAAYEYWRNAILSGPQTHIVNIVGNTLNTGWNFTAKRFVEAAVNTAVRDPKAAQWGEFKYLWRGALGSLSRASKNYLLTWRTEQSQFEVDVGKRNDPGGGVPFHESGDAAIAGKWGRFVRSPQRFLAASDDFMKTLIAHAEVEARAYRIAKSEGLEGEGLVERIHEQMMDLNSDAWNQAVHSAHELTFQAELGRLAKGILKFRKDVAGSRYFFPFITTPANIFKQGVKMSPLGLATPVLNKFQTGKWGVSPAFLAEQAIAWAVVYALVGNDPDDPWITGAADDADPKTRDLARRTFPPMTIKIGGTRYSYARIEPFATALALTVDVVNGFKSKKPGGFVTAPLTSLRGQAMNKTFLSGLSDAMRVAENPTDNAPKWASNFTVSWWPNIFRSTSREADDEFDERRIWGKGEDWWKRLGKRTVQKSELKIVGDMPKFDLWGRKIPTSHPQGNFVWKLLSPMRTKKDDVFIADRILVEWNNDHPGEEYRPIAPSPRRSDGSYMTDEEYQRYAELSGTIARKILEAELLDADDPTQGDIDAIKAAVRDARKIASQDPDGDPKSIAAEISRRHIQSKAAVLTRRPPHITPAMRRKALADGITPVALRMRKIAELKAAQEAALKWLKDRGVKFGTIRSSYQPNVKPATRAAHLQAIRRHLSR
jgi:hypothetical protein